MSQIKRKTEIIERLEGGLHKVETEEWWIVRMVCKNTGLVGPYLRCKNAYQAKVRGKRRKWHVTYVGYCAYRFATKAEAKRAIKCKAVQERLTGEKWRTKEAREVVEIVRVTKRTETISSETHVVEERPGCNPMLSIALEAKQADERAKQAAKRKARDSA